MHPLLLVLMVSLLFSVFYLTYLAEQTDFKQFTYECVSCRQDPDRISPVPRQEAETSPFCKRCGRPMNIIEEERLF